MDCFIDSVGLQYCQGETPASGLYLNSLPGISIESIDKIADSDQVTYLGVFADVQTNAKAQFRLDILTELNKCYRLNKDCDYDTLICDNTDVLYQAWKYLLGVHVMMFRQASDRLNWFTTVSLEDAKTLQGLYQNSYEESLQQGIKLMDTSECCMKCEPSPKRVVWMP